MATAAETRRDAAEEVIVRELGRLVDVGGGQLPRGYANQIYQTLRAAGLGIRRQDTLRLTREYAEFLQAPGQVRRAVPERHAPARSEAAQAVKRQAALDVVALIRRDGLSLGQAVRAHNRTWPEARVSAASVKRLVPKALEMRGSRWRATAYDRYARTTDAITTRGVERVTVRDSRTASLIARHAAAVDAYLSGKADASVLHPFRGKSFRGQKRAYQLETDPARLEELGTAGELNDLEIGSHQGLAA
ncbi:MAG: hypothetical protein M3R02_19535 [Chloroflexota bacterium]|nr:hypothetical protein [Chloroflexota bacterium]